MISEKQTKQIELKEWRCRLCGRLIMKYLKGSSGEWHHVCRNCKAENHLVL